jgi:hypothetical protein
MEHKPWFNEGCSQLLDPRENSELQSLDDPNQINGDNLNNVRRDASRHFRYKKREYLMDRINELATHRKKALLPVYAFLSFLTRATCTPYLILLDLIILIIFEEESKLRSSSLCNSLESPIISSLLSPNIHLSTLFSVNGLPLLGDTKLQTHTNLQAKLYCSFSYFNLYVSKQQTRGQGFWNEW